MKPTQDINREESLLSTQDSGLSTQDCFTRQPCLISVVVPTYKRPELLNRCLAALCSQTMNPSEYEIVVVDDGPTENTKHIVLAWSLRSGPRMRYLANEGRHGPAAARNKGWRAAHGELIAFTDDDCVPAPDWLAIGSAVFEDPTVHGISGRIIVPIPSIPSRSSRRGVTPLRRVIGMSLRSRRVLATAGRAYRHCYSRMFLFAV